jgi:type I restriction-modification system DNA methylase subunit
MSIFQKSVIKNYLAGIDKEQLETAYSVFQKNYPPQKTEIIKKLKEEEYQDGFLRDIFAEVLGYTLKPDDNFNLVREFKNPSDSRKADGAILKDGKAKAVIELKSAKTKDLKTVAEQAFNYKNNQPDCKYVITSNFQKLRFYIDSAHEYEEFDLFRLNKDDFDRMFLLLCKESILQDIPEKLKKASVSHEESVSKQLYADYSVFRKKLFENLTENNPAIDTLTLFGKTQTLIDRFLFILFAEDKGLLPPNSVNRMIQRFHTLREEDAYKPLYEIYKQYFGYMNTGRPGKSPADDIPAYNGGLFYPDDVLNHLKIDDDILTDDLQKLSAYDFDTEVDVNILGHIFEHSLSEIEETAAKIKGTDIDKSKSRRKKDGIFYTPQYITQYIVENTLGRLCEEKRSELDIKEIEFDDTYYTKKGNLSKKGRILYQTLEDYKNWLLSLKILDPACGSGAFLNQALNFLIREHNFIIDVQTDLKQGQISVLNIEKAVLENNLYGVDINEESVEITKLSLWLRTAHRKRKLSNLNSNIRCGNSLIDDPEIAGDKAFKWEKEFPEIMENGGFDAVIGNPPYVFAREKISEKEKKYYALNYCSSQYQVNTYLLFIEKTVKLLRKDGKFALIVPNAWLMVNSAINLREFLLKSSYINSVVNLSGYSFEGVNVETIIINAKKKKTQNPDLKIFLSKGREFKYSHSTNQADFNNNNGFEFKIFSDDTGRQITEKIGQYSEILDNMAVIKAGLQAYEKGKGNPKQTAEDVKKRPYDYDYKFDDTTYEYLEGKDVSRYFRNWSGLYLKYGDNLAAPRTFDIFSGPKIIVREITGGFPRSIISTYTEDIVLFNRSNIAIIEKDNAETDLKYILAIINSSLLSYYFLLNTAKSVRKMFPKIILKDLRQFPIKRIRRNEQQPFIEKADIMLSKSKALHERKSDFLNFFKSELTPQKITKKLENWNDLDWEQLKKEMEKCKIRGLSLKARKQWQDYFIEQKEKAGELKSVIDSTDKEIDQMVYELYGLTQEEIEIVEKCQATS